MRFDPDRLLAMPPIETVASHGVRDVILYALGVGIGIDSATAPETLRYTYEDGIAVLPTMASVLASPGFWMQDPAYGMDWKRIVAGEASLEWHAPLPVEGSLTSLTSVDDIFDKGPDKGAVMLWRRELFDNRTGNHLATERKSAFLRGDGGKGGRTDASPSPPSIPDRPADISISLPTRADQALIYRLSGDYNPLHIDPAVAADARFHLPILHGLCTYGVAGRALLRGLELAGATNLTTMSCRFSLPVYPGETIVTDIWKLEDGVAAYQCRTQDRNALVLTHGRADYIES
jgi:acyl dehydratase